MYVHMFDLANQITLEVPTFEIFKFDVSLRGLHFDTFEIVVAKRSPASAKQKKTMVLC